MKILDTISLAAVKINTGDINYNPTATDNSVLTNVLNTVYFWAAIIAIIVIVIGGFMFTLSRSDPGQVTRAKNAILYAIVGLVIVLVAFAITNFVVGVF